MTLLGAIPSDTDMVTVDAKPAPHGWSEVTGLSTVSATLEDVTGCTFDITTSITGGISTTLTVGCSTTGGSPSTGAWAISINASDGAEISRYLSGVNDMGSLAVQAHTTSLVAGTYTVKARHRRVSGSSTVNTDVAQLRAEFVSE